MHLKSQLQKFFIILFALLIILFSMPVKASEKRVIRVGYPLMDGLSMKDKDGNYYGYDYDYLMQIAQYTGWEYEFVEVDGDLNERITKLMDMLKKGEIDLLGDTRYMESMTDDYDYSSEPYGSAYNVLATLADSEIQDAETLLNHNKLKIAVSEKATKRISLLDQYAEVNGFSYDKIYFNTDEEAYNLVKSKKADMLLGIDLSMPSQFHPIAKFSPDPFYFITTKGNTEITTELNQALVNINRINPTLTSTLYNRYFSGNTSDFILNNSEKAYLKKHKTLNVLIRDGSAPVQYLVDGKPYGIGKDILDQLSKDTGITFNYIKASNYEEYKKLARSDKTDILAGIPFETKSAHAMDAKLSDPYISNAIILITSENINPSDLDNKIQATDYYKDQTYDNNKNLKYYESPEEVMKKINRHEADYAYLNSYMYRYYSNKSNYQKISSFSTPDYLRSQYAFGVTDTEDLTLLSILNKSIRSQEKRIDSYIYKNAYYETDFNIADFIINHIFIIIASILIIIALIITALRRYYMNQLKMKKAVELEYKRYQMLSDISREMTFSYNYHDDEWKITSAGIGYLANEEQTKCFSMAVADKGKFADITRLIYNYLKEEKDIFCEEKSRMLHDDERWYQISIKVINEITKNRVSAVYAVGKVIDIQNEKEEREKLRIKSRTDSLTGLLNRGAAEEEISAILRTDADGGALLLLDLDNFKDVNDQYGHIEGDHVLADTAELLQDIFSGNIVSRLGGDEFLIYIRKTSDEEIHANCNALLNRIRTLNALKDKNITLTLSVGIVYAVAGLDFLTLVKMADEKLYEVKSKGRNGFIIYQ